jgi:hypothetical protein
VFCKHEKVGFETTGMKNIEFDWHSPSFSALALALIALS